MQFRNADAAISVSRSFSKCKTNESKNNQVPAARESTDVRVAYHLQKVSGKPRCESNSKWNTTFSVVPAKLSGSNGTSEKASSRVVPNRNSCAISSTLFDGLILRLDTVTF